MRTAVSCLLALCLLVGVSTMLSAQGQEPPPAGPDPDAKISECPYMYVPPEANRFPPVVPSGPLDLTAEQIANLPPPETMITHDLTPPKGGLDMLWGGDPGEFRDFISTVHGTDDRVQVTATTSNPWRWIGKLYISFSHGNYIGSAYLVSDNVCLTAGHCVWDSADTDGWADQIVFVPGMNGTAKWNGNYAYKPYNHAYATGLTTWTAWTGSADPNHDIGMIKLDRNIGDYVGKYSYHSRDKTALEGMTINVSGYPGDKPTGTHWFDYDTAQNVTDTKIYYDADTYGGQSGGPAWTYVGGTRWAEGVHAYGGATLNSATKITTGKKNTIDSHIAAHTATDRPDLVDDGAAYSGHFPGTVQAWDDFDVWMDVRNIGTANATGFRVSFRASTNTTITTGDREIGYVDVPSCARFDWENVNLFDVPFPANIPAGTYYVGWIIDSLGSQNEFVESNNTAYEGQVTVQEKDPELAWAGTAGYTTDGINPNNASGGSTFTFKVKYIDGSGAAPTKSTCRIYKRIGPTWKFYRKLNLTQESGSISTGAVYSGSTALGNWTWKHKFYFTDSGSAVVPGTPTAWTQLPRITGAPRLFWAGQTRYTVDGVHPNSGTVGTKFTFKVMYQDSYGSGPSTYQLLIRRNGVPFKTKNMNKGTAGDMRLGKIYSASWTATAGGNYTYRFKFIQGGFNAKNGEKTGNPTTQTGGPNVSESAALAVSGLTAGVTNVGAQITFTLSAGADVSAEVLNVAGRPIRMVALDTPLDAGLQTLLWDGKDGSGLAAPPGRYLVRVTARTEDGGQTNAMATLAVR